MVLVIAAVVLTGCASVTRSSTRYETYQYSVAFPDDLGIAPLDGHPEHIWSHPSSFMGATSAVAVDFWVRNVPVCIAETAMMQAGSLAGNGRLTSVNGPTGREFPVGPAAVYTGQTLVGERIGIVACGPNTIIYMLATGISRADAETIMESLVLRIPPGDPAHPPSAEPSGG